MYVLRKYNFFTIALNGKKLTWVQIETKPILKGSLIGAHRNKTKSFLFPEHENCMTKKKSFVFYHIELILVIFFSFTSNIFVLFMEMLFECLFLRWL